MIENEKTLKSNAEEKQAIHEMLQTLILNTDITTLEIESFEDVLKLIELKVLLKN